MKKTSIMLTVGTLLTGSGFTHAASILRITEVMSGGDVADWFEITNYGDTAADISTLRVDDNSFNISTSLLLEGISSIAPGQSVIFIEGDNNTASPFANIAQFRANWNLGAGVLVGGYQGTQISFGGGGDGTTLFSNLAVNGGAELPGPFSGLVRVTFGSNAASNGSSFEWTYDSAGASVTAAVFTASGTSGLNGTSALLGTPGYVPEPSSLLLGGLGVLGLLRRRRA